MNCHAGFDSWWGQCKNRASRPSHGTVYGVAVSKCPLCRWDVKHNKPTNKNFNVSNLIISTTVMHCAYAFVIKVLHD